MVCVSRSKKDTLLFKKNTKFCETGWNKRDITLYMYTGWRGTDGSHIILGVSNTINFQKSPVSSKQIKIAQFSFYQQTKLKNCISPPGCTLIKILATISFTSTKWNLANVFHTYHTNIQLTVQSISAFLIFIICVNLTYRMILNCYWP